MPRFRYLNVIFGWGKLGQSGHRASIGFALPQLFREQLGQLGQICFIRFQGVQEAQINHRYHLTIWV